MMKSLAGAEGETGDEGVLTHEYEEVEWIRLAEAPDPQLYTM